MTTTALIVAAGSGTRLGGDLPKQYRPLGGKPVVRWAVEALLGHPAINAVRVVIGKGQEAQASAALDGLDVGRLVPGGPERADSVRAGLGQRHRALDQPAPVAGHQADGVTGAQAALPQLAGQPVGAGVDLTPGQGTVVVHTFSVFP